MSALIDALLNEWRRGGERARCLFANIPVESISEQPGGLTNHPLWCFGHLSLYHPSIVRLVSGEAIDDPALLPEAPLFANGSKPQASRQSYPDLQELFERYLQGHAYVDAAIGSMDEAVLNRAPGLERWTSMGDTAAVLIHLTVWHEAHHLAEVACWKKAMRLPVVG